MAEPGTLSDRLGRFAERLAIIGPDYAAYYGRLVNRLISAGTGSSAPGVGDRMPEFALINTQGRVETLSAFLAKCPLVVTFKRGHWCEFCRIEVDGLIRAYPQIRRLGAEVAAILPEAMQALEGLQRVAGVPFPLLTDLDNAYALELGIAMPVDRELRQMLIADGIDLAGHQGGSGALLPLPATFVIAPDRRVVARFVDADFRTRMETDAIVGALRAIESPASRL
jgi:peroxiredoxin